MSEALETTAKLYDEAARELDQAAKHCEVAAQHFRDNLVPRGTAHAWAARGHMLEAEERLDEQAREHARRSVPEA
jgi:tetratricopeptide (TPR) repeat protein